MLLLPTRDGGGVMVGPASLAVVASNSLLFIPVMTAAVIAKAGAVTMVDIAIRAVDPVGAVSEDDIVVA